MVEQVLFRVPSHAEVPLLPRHVVKEAKLLLWV